MLIAPISKFVATINAMVYFITFFTNQLLTLSTPARKWAPKLIFKMKRLTPLTSLLLLAAGSLFAQDAPKKLKDVQANKGNVDVVVEVVTKESPRTFEKFGKKGKVCNAQVRDATGTVVLTLWNDDADKVNIGDKIHLLNGWCAEYKGEKQLSAGKFGKIEVVDGSEKTVFTNDPGILTGEKGGNGDDDDGDDGDEEPIDEEELVE